jgi:S-DNA-T family DNA segregation ATPase FtsK/SpoIIIE
VERITAVIGSQRGCPEAYKLPEYVDVNEIRGREFDLADRDPLFKEAARLIVQTNWVLPH